MYKKSALLPERPPFDVLEGMPHPSFVVSEDLNITFCNSAWDRFALENSGPAEVLARNVIGKHLLNFISGNLKAYYAQLFPYIRALGRRGEQSYECSSSSVFRRFQMQIFPLAQGHGFVICNSLRVEGPHSADTHEPTEPIYRDSHGLIHMCANCRRTRRADASDGEIWDWVPDFVDSGVRNISHGICPMCVEYYYGPFLARARHNPEKVA